MDQLTEAVAAIDLEATRSGHIRHIGAICKGVTFEWQGKGRPGPALTKLADFCRRADFVLGHNIFNHDLPLLKSIRPGLRILDLPVIDTLYLSPLAFPRNPYHRLVKNYKLVRSARSHPIEDARLALAVFKDQWESFKQQVDETPDLAAFYRFCMERSRFSGFSGAGMAKVFGLLGAPEIQNHDQAGLVFMSLCNEAACHHALQDALAGEWNAAAAAYALAWLRVAGGNSVLPPWVRYQFPEVVPLLKKLRDVPCGHSDCTYCRTMHDPDTQLKRFFGFDAFRPKPCGQDGQSLQRAAVIGGFQDAPLMAILPTGGGKSLCYQLPALVRHMRRGLLTVVISPLQALMKDQVDNLERSTGTPFAAAIYGLLTPPERGEVLERIRMGDVAILYLAPEQLRSKSVRTVLKQREIGCWVFDEAHCLSKWGHDFRPDYMYAARFIREFSRRQKLPLPPVACFTATAKLDVIEEVADYFQTELQQELHLLAGGVERDNLSFEIRPASGAQKPEMTFDIVSRYLREEDPVSIVVYAAKRKTTEEIQTYLNQKGVLAEAFHAGLEPNKKRRVIEDFVAGEIPVICATNAFGMGIDKDNIRLVLHYDIPGSLENYLQEAGRAGRDLKPADCILLYDPKDAETQFKLGAVSEIKKDEIQRILKCLRHSKRNRWNEIVVTTQELLRDEDLMNMFEKGDRSSDTKVKTAVSWLERADFLQRNQNLTQVFQGKPLVRSLREAEPIIEKQGLSPVRQKLWRGILGTMFNAAPDQGLGADDIAESLFASADTLSALEKQYGLTPAQLVIHAMHDMASAGLLDKGMVLSAFVRPRGRNHALIRFEAVDDLEERLLKLMQEEAPDAETGDWMDLDISRVNQRLRNEGLESNPVTVRNLVKGLSYDGKGLAGSVGSVELRHVSRNRYRVSLQRCWPAILETAALRRNVARVIVEALIEKAGQGRPDDAKGSAGELLVEFSANELTDAIKMDLLLHSQVQKPLAAVDRGLMFLHEHKIITLQHGLAVFRQAMTIRLNPDAKRRQYKIGDFKPLAVHYRERRFQVHVMAEYAKLAMDKIARALRLILDYFSMPREHFAEKYFAGREALLRRATSAESYRQIVESLNHPVQMQITGAPVEVNMLILAGPGAGKTRVVVHRCAYLLRVERIAANRILVLCFNHNGAVALRKRLKALVGRDARGVTVATYHGAAMRLTGLSVRTLIEDKGAAEMNFDGLIRDAVALLKGEKETPGVDPDEIRDLLLQGFSHILVDEYQDIDDDQYELVSAIAGRTLAEGEGRLSILAVGDDDQNIYTFRGANIAFIKRFRKDYHAETVYMVENYRSSAHITAAANQLIAANRDRMKHDQPIRVNRHRADQPAGGPWERLDPLIRGQVQRLVVQDAIHQGEAVYQELMRLKSLKPSLDWQTCAVLARTNKTLSPVRTVFEEKGLPMKRRLETGIPLHRIRQTHQLLSRLKAVESDIRRAEELVDLLPPEDVNPWTALLIELHTAFREETDNARLPVRHFMDWLYEVLAEQRREKTIGPGIFLNTIHGAKGLEFEHVFILDGDWHIPPEQSKQEEERRLLYVGMTRAKETLCLLEIENQANPLSTHLKGDFLIRRKAGPGDPLLPDDRLRHYQILGLSDIHLSYAGGFPPNHPIHEHLSRIDAGDTIYLTANGSTIEIQDQERTTIGQLSKAAGRQWAGRLPDILEAHVLGMIHWSAKDSESAYSTYLKAASWELPMIELVCAEHF